MKKRNKVILIIGISIIILLLIVLGIKWPYCYRYEAAYCNNQILFEGEFKKNYSLEYNRVQVRIQNKHDGSGNNVVSEGHCRILDEKKIKVHINELSFEIKELTPKIMADIGGQKIESIGDISTWQIKQPAGHNPPYHLICAFNDNKISSLYFSIRNPADPSMGMEQLCPISFFFDDSQRKIKIPITKKKLIEFFGTPNRVGKFLKWP